MLVCFLFVPMCLRAQNMLNATIVLCGYSQQKQPHRLSFEQRNCAFRPCEHPQMSHRITWYGHSALFWIGMIASAWLSPKCCTGLRMEAKAYKTAASD